MNNNLTFNDRIKVDDSNFIFLPSGVFPIEYENLNPGLEFRNYFNEVIKPWKDGKIIQILDLIIGIQIYIHFFLNIGKKFRMK